MATVGVASSSSSSSSSSPTKSISAVDARRAQVARELFETLDSDSDGILVPDDLRAFIDEEDKLMEVVQILDPKGRGQITLQEFTQGFESFYGPIDDTDLSMDDDESKENVDTIQDLAPMNADDRRKKLAAHRRNSIQRQATLRAEDLKGLDLKRLQQRVDPSSSSAPTSGQSSQTSSTGATPAESPMITPRDDPTTQNVISGTKKSSSSSLLMKSKKKANTDIMGKKRPGAFQYSKETLTRGNRFQKILSWCAQDQNSMISLDELKTTMTYLARPFTDEEINTIEQIMKEEGVNAVNTSIFHKVVQDLLEIEEERKKDKSPMRPLFNPSDFVAAFMESFRKHIQGAKSVVQATEHQIQLQEQSIAEEKAAEAAESAKDEEILDGKHHIRSLSITLQTTSKRLETATAITRELERENALLRAQKSDLESTVAELKSTSAELKTNFEVHKNLVESLQKQQATLEQAARQTRQEHQGALALLQVERKIKKSMETELKSLKDQLAELQTSRSAQSRLDLRLRMGQMTQLMNERRKFNQVKAQSERIPELEEENKRLRATIEQLEQDAIEHQRLLDAARNGFAFPMANRSVGSLSDDMDPIENRLQNAEAALAQEKAHRDELMTLVSKLQSELDESRREIISLHQRHDELLKQLEEMVAKVNQREAELNKLVKQKEEDAKAYEDKIKSMMTSHTDALHTLQERLNLETAALNDVRKQNDAYVIKIGTYETSITDYKQQLSTSQALIDHHKRQLSEAQQTLLEKQRREEELLSLNQELTTALESLHKLNDDAKAKYTAESKEKDDMIASLRTELSRSREAWEKEKAAMLASHTQEITNWRTKYDALQTTLNDATREHDATQRRLQSEAKLEMDQLRASTAAELASAASKQAQSDAQLASTRAELDALRTRLTAELDALRIQLKQEQEKCGKLEQAKRDHVCQAPQSTTEEMKMLQQRLLDANAQITDLSSRLQQLTSTHQDLLTRTAHDDVTHRAELANLQSRMDAELQSLRDELMKQTLGSNDTSARYQNEIDALKRQIETVKQQWSAEKLGNNKLKEELKEMQQQLATQQALVTSLQQQLSTFATLQSEYDKLKQQYATQASELSDLQQTMVFAHQQNTKLTSELQRERDHYHRWKALQDEKEKELAALKANMVEKERMMEDAAILITSLQSDMDAARKDIHTLRIEISQLTSQLEASQQHVVELESRIATLEKQLSDAQTEIERLRKEIADHVCFVPPPVVVEVIKPVEVPALVPTPQPEPIKHTWTPQPDKFTLTPEKQAELSAYSTYFNICLANDPDLQHLLPIDSSTQELLRKIGDGLLIAKFINIAVPGTIDERVINKRQHGETLDWQEIVQNLNLCISASKSIGVTMRSEASGGPTRPHVIPHDIIASSGQTSGVQSGHTSDDEGDPIQVDENIGVMSIGQGLGLGAAQLQLMDCTEPDLVIDFLYQLIKTHLFYHINLRTHPELKELMKSPTLATGSKPGSVMSSPAPSTKASLMRRTSLPYNGVLPELSLDDLQLLSPEQLLLRWLNYHIIVHNHQTPDSPPIQSPVPSTPSTPRANAKLATKAHAVANFSSDLTDAAAYLAVLGQISQAMISIAEVEKWYKEQESKSDNKSTSTQNTPRATPRPTPIKPERKTVSFAIDDDDEVTTITSTPRVNTKSMASPRVVTKSITSPNVTNKSITSTSSIVPPLKLPTRTFDTSTPASRVLAWASQLDIQHFHEPNNITSGHERLNLLLVAVMFNHCTALNVPNVEDLKKQAIKPRVEMFRSRNATMDLGVTADDESSREEQSFRMWINSSGIPDVYVHNLGRDLRDGIVLLKLVDWVEPGLVEWKRVDMTPNNKFKMVGNCNYLLQVVKPLRLSLVGIGGPDIYDINQKYILSIIWQLMRYHTIKQLAAINTSSEQGSDNAIIEWANKKVASKPVPQCASASKMKSFRDPILSDSLFILNLIHTLDERLIDWNLVITATSDREKLMNARYAMSLARKLGASIFLSPWDIVEVKPKMILLFIASLMAIESTM